MKNLIDKVCEETRSKDAKRISPAHMKSCIANNEQFDFLNDLVSKIPDGDDKGKKGRPRYYRFLLQFC